MKKRFVLLFILIACHLNMLQAESAVPHIGFTIDLNGTIMQRDDLDFGYLLADGSDEEIQNTIFVSFRRFLQFLEELKVEGKLTYHIAFNSYCKTPEVFPLSAELLSRALKQEIKMGHLDENNSLYVVDDKQPITSPEAILDFLKSNTLTIMRGSFVRWQKHGYLSEGGKPLFMNTSAGLFGIGWDDNLKVPKWGNDVFIFQPLTPQGEPIPYEQAETWCTMVNTVDSMTNENYFIELFIDTIQRNQEKYPELGQILSGQNP